MTGRKLFLAILVFLIYQAAIWGLVYRLLPAPGSLLAGVILTACGNTLLALYVLALYPAPRPRSEVAPWPAIEAVPWPAIEAVPSPAIGAALSPTTDPVTWPPSEPAPQPPIEPAPPVPAPTTEPPRLADTRPVIRTDTAAPAALIAEARKRLDALPREAGIPRGTAIGNLPMHFVFGPEGCGKTTLVLLSEVEAKLLAGHGRPARNIWLVGHSLLVEQGGRSVGRMRPNPGACWSLSAGRQGFGM